MPLSRLTFARRSAPAAHAGPGPSRTWPWAVGSIAAVVIVLGATLLGHALVSGRHVPPLAVAAPAVPPLAVVAATSPAISAQLVALDASAGHLVALTTS